MRKFLPSSLVMTSVSEIACLPKNYERTFSACSLRLLAVVAMAAMPLALHADIDSPVVPPPQPIPLAVQTKVGGSIEITLRARSRTGLPLKFLIRSQPESGSLTEPVSDGNYSAKLIYRHDPSRHADVDSFSYAVQAPNTSVSASERVVIRIIEPPSDFDAPTSIAFGGVLLGESESKTITLKNQGGGIIAGKLLLPEPWTISNGGIYSLGAGRSKDFIVTFTPREAHQYRETTAYSHDAKYRVALSGEGLLPLRVPTKSLSLQLNETGEREGEFDISNVSYKSQIVKFQTPPNLLPLPSVTIPAGETKKIPLRIGNAYRDAFNAEVGIQCGAFKATIEVTAFAVPPKLSFSVTKKLDFGNVMSGRAFRQSLSITNSGGAPAHLRAIAPDEVTFSPDLAKTPVPPGKTVVFEITFEPNARTQPPMDIVFMREDQEIHHLSLAFILKNTAADLYHAPPALVPEPIKTPDLPQMEKMVTPALSDKLSSPLIDRFTILEQRRNSFTIAWDKPEGDSLTGFTLECRIIKTGSDGKPEWIWSRLRNVHTSTEGNRMSVTVSGLPAGSLLVYRIVAMDKSGTLQVLSNSFSISTKVGNPFRITPLQICIALFLVLSFFVWRQRKRRMAELSVETDRIHRSR